MSGPKKLTPAQKKAAQASAREVLIWDLVRRGGRRASKKARRIAREGK